MTAHPRRRATYQDVLDTPEWRVAELIAGELHVSPRPAGPHTSVASTLGIALGAPFHLGRGGPGGWIILDEPELHLGADILIPDLAGWRRDRMAAVDDAPYFTVAPNWLCEVMSPSTERIDRALKLPRYAAAGVDHAWLLQPRDRTLEVLRRQDNQWLVLGVHQGDDLVRAEPFDAVELELAVLWADLAATGKPTYASEPAAPYGAGEHAR